jgi:hypothetical protein
MTEQSIDLVGYNNCQNSIQKSIIVKYNLKGLNLLLLYLELTES